MKKIILIGAVAALACGAALAAKPNAVAISDIQLVEGAVVSLQDAEASSCSYRGKLTYTKPTQLINGGWQIGIREYVCLYGKGATFVRSFAGAAFLKVPAKAGDRLFVLGQFL